jgi:hypothetical protein
MPKDLFVRIRVDNEDKMLKLNDVIGSPLFKKMNEILNSELEVKRKLKEEMNNASRILIKNYPNIDFESKTFDILERRIESCNFDLYIPSKDIIIGKEFDLD